MMLRMDEYKDDLSFLNSMKEYKLRGYKRGLCQPIWKGKKI